MVQVFPAVNGCWFGTDGNELGHQVRDHSMEPYYRSMAQSLVWVSRLQKPDLRVAKMAALIAHCIANQ